MKTTAMQKLPLQCRKEMWSSQLTGILLVEAKEEAKIRKKTEESKGSDIIMNGKFQSAGKVETSKDADGKTLTTVTVDSEKQKLILTAEKEKNLAPMCH